MMCPECKPACTSASVTSVHPPPEIAVSSFCAAADGGISMYMDGFAWTSRSSEKPCLVFLAGNLVIDTPWKFAVACLSVFLIACCAEQVTLARQFCPQKRQQDV